MNEIPADLVCLGKIIDAYGVKGWVKVRPYSEPDVLLTAKHWWLKRDAPVASHATPNYQSYRALNVKEHSGSVVASLETCVDRTMAEGLKGYEVFVARTEFPAAEDGSYYWIDLIGCEVQDTQKNVLGRILEVTDNGAQALLVVHAYQQPLQNPPQLALEKNKPITFLIPFVEQYVLDVDLPNKNIVVDWALDW